MSRTEMQLGEAIEVIVYQPGGWPCACSGPWPVCACARVMAEVRSLHRAAHIVARQLADYATAREAAEMGA